MSRAHRHPRHTAAVWAACKPPIEAPEDLYDLPAYIYGHGWDVDQEALTLGLEQLTIWLEANPDAALERHAIGPLSEATIDALDEKDRSTTDMVSLSLTRLSHHPIEDSTWALVSVDQSEIFPATFAEYEREYISGPECFVERSCERMEAIEEVHNTFPLGLESWGSAYNQYAWAELDGGSAMMHRNWEIEPPETSSNLMTSDERAYLSLFLPVTTGAWRLQALWTVYSDDNNTPVGLSTSMVLGFFEDSHADLETWLDENPAP